MSTSYDGLAHFRQKMFAQITLYSQSELPHPRGCRKLSLEFSKKNLSLQFWYSAQRELGSRHTLVLVNWLFQKKSQWQRLEAATGSRRPTANELDEVIEKGKKGPEKDRFEWRHEMMASNEFEAEVNEKSHESQR
jgi:hypothetical protein